MGSSFASHFAEIAKNKTSDFTSWHDGKLKGAETARDKVLKQYYDRMEG
jgi:hypothetical protein